MKIKKFQVGGAAPAPTPVEAAAPAPEDQIMGMAQEIVNQLGPEAAAMLADAIMQMLQGGGAPQEAPVFARKGGKLTRVN